MAYRKLTLKDKKKIYSLITEYGISYAAVSERYDISESFITKLMKSARDVIESRRK
ncbi:hypothetical protein KAR91_22105 [Candidatus Pacearchaeota archaeon]|nr:hypothetical protein [Candidatus Pacearchaeota archaeon]